MNMTNTEYLRHVGEDAINFVISSLEGALTRPQSPEMAYYYRGQIDVIAASMLLGHPKVTIARDMLLKADKRLHDERAEFDRRSGKIDRDKAQSGEAYVRHFDDAIAAQRVDYMTEFGETYRAKHPFQPDSLAAHKFASEKVSKPNE